MAWGREGSAWVSWGGRLRWRTAAGFEDLVERLDLRDPRRAVAFRRGEEVTDSGSSRVLRFRDPEPDGDLFYFKVYRYYRVRPVFTFTYRPSRARTEYEALIALRAAGLPAPEPVAYGAHRRFWRLIVSCFVVSRGIEGAVNLQHWLRDHEDLLASAAFRPLRRRGLDELAGLVARMHAVDFFDHDLWYRNILVTRKAEDAPLEFHFIDHPKARVIPATRRRARRAALVYDLMSLDKHAHRHFRRGERLRFFKRYLGRERLTEDDRALLREVARLRQKMMRRRQKKIDRKAQRIARRGPESKRSWDAKPERSA